MLTKDLLQKLLGRLDDDPEVAGARYEALRRGLVRFFEWRGSLFPDQHADETLDRVARKLGEGKEEVRDLHGYAVGVARMIHLEGLREHERERERARLHTVSAPPGDPGRGGGGSAAEADVRLECVRRCVQRLPRESARALLTYYQEDRARKIETRRQLAAELEVSLPTLRMRMQRLRASLERCASACLEEGAARVGH